MRLATHIEPQVLRPTATRFQLNQSETLIFTMPAHQLSIRVTYQETDGQRRVHHANYLNYFERGRVEMLRDQGLPYREIEDSGCLLVVREMNVIYHAAAEFDDLLTLTTEVVEVRKVRIRHRYRLERDGELIVEGESLIASVDHQGKPMRLPDNVKKMF